MKENKNNTFQKNDFTEYQHKLDAFTSLVEFNKTKITDKIQSPSKSVVLDSFDIKIQEINEVINKLNITIEENNNIVSAKNTKQKECESNIWEHMAFMVKEDTKNYRKEKRTAESKIDELKIKKKELSDKINNLKREISELSSQIVNIDSAIKSINKKLFDSGFQGFKIQKKVNDPNKYEIIRDDGSPAHGLSEGERNFIAFLYFYHKVLGKESANSIFKNRIVVIDDPVSSMDSNSLFIVGSIIRELISICFNNGIATKQDAKLFIKQIFILTHNAFFHKEISYDRLRYYHCVNFYLIKKERNVSTVNLCVKKDPFSKEPALEHNYSPVHNSYATLWKEYNEASSPQILMRVVRQILEYYFIQISGYEGHSLIERILKAENVFIKTESDGSENRDLLHSVNAMLRYIGSNKDGFNDGLDYIEGHEHVDSVKEAFKSIFTAMEQEQHYQMMMQIGC